MRSRTSWILLLAVALLWAAAPASADVSIVNFDGSPDLPGDPGYRGGSLGVEVRSGSHRGLSRFVEVPGSSPDEAWFRYMLALDAWSPSQAGKLPGFASLRSHTGRGCFPSTASSPGWSARMMYRASGTMGASEAQSRIGYYVYHLDQPKDCGEIMEWDDNAVLDTGRWYCIEGHIELNDVGQANGVLEGWVDGEPAFERTGLQFRRTADIGVDDFWMNVYSGGKKPSSEDLSLRVDEVALSDSGPIGCPDAFDDDEENVHEQAMNRLADMDAFRGCGAFRACPDDPITRGDFLGLVARVAGFDPGPDAFDDDGDHPAEAGIDALAAAGVVAGCGERSVCPDEPIARAEAAGVLVSAFGLPPGDPAGFVDIGDPGLAAAADALAAAGVTGGCRPRMFCPGMTLTRSQAAALVANAVSQSRVPTAVSGRQRRPTMLDAYARQPLSAPLPSVLVSAGARTQ